MRHIFDQRGPVRLKRMAPESPPTVRLRPKALIRDFENIVQTSQSKSNVYHLPTANSNPCPSFPDTTVCVTPPNIPEQNRFSLVMKAFPYLQFEPSKSSTPVRKKIPSTVGPTVIDGVTKVTITVEFPSKTVRKELSPELSSLGKALVFGPDDRIACAVIKNPTLSRSAVNLVLKKLGEELNDLCARKNLSVLRKSAKDDIMNFSLEKVCLELKERTPLFYGVLMTCANAKKETHGFLA